MNSLIKLLTAVAVSSVLHIVLSTQSLADEKVDEETILRQQVALRCKKVGEKAPDFELKDGEGKTTHLSAELKKGPVILAFYRGGWCPFCSEEMHELESHISQFQKMGARLVAVSPQTPTKSEWFENKAKLTFPVLSDNRNVIARQYGLVYKVSAQTRMFLAKNGVILKNYNGDDSNELPLPATFLIKRDGFIAYVFVDSDFTKRVKAERIVKELESIDSH